MLNRLSFVLAIGLATSTARAAIINVPGDQPTIGDAIAAAVNGDEILIAPGTYNQGSVIPLNNKAITLRGSGGAAVTILEGPSPFLHIITVVSVEADTVFDGLTFTNSVHGFGSGVMDLVGSGPTIQNCIFSNNLASAIGGNSVAGMTITNCQFIGNNDDETLGAAISLNGGVGPTITNCTFTNNSAGGGGGAIYIVTGGIISGCTFDSNSTDLDTGLDGGAAVYQVDGDLVIDNCTFTGNMSVERGGAIEAELTTGSLTITNCDFTGNTAAADGGAVHSSGAGTLDITDCTFDMNESTGGNGGAAWIQGAGASMTTCTFTTNTAGNGGGIALDGAAVLDSTFTGNTATANGGGILVEGGSSSVTNCFASNNIAGGTGGGMYIAVNAIATVIDSTFCQNTTDDLVWDGLILAQHVVAGLGDDECDQSVALLGACCLPTDGCALMTEPSCSAAGGVYQGVGTSCAAAACPPACVGDTDGDGTVGIQDFLAVLAAWGVCP